MSNSREELLRLLEEDDTLGLINKEEKNVPIVGNSVLFNNFEEIVYFFEEHGREPKNSKNIKEFQLYCRLRSIRENPAMIKQLKPYDIYNLLSGEGIQEVPLIDIIKDDPSFLIDDELDSSIFQLINVQRSTRISPDYVAHRKFCRDFEKYEPLFNELHSNLENNVRKLAIYHPTDLIPGRFFVLNGVVVYLKSVDGKEDKFDFPSGSRVRFDGRTECIFDNGTTSDMLYRSLDKALQKDGYSITEPREYADEPKATMVAEDDVQNGYIYVLRTMHKSLRNVPDVYKIGSTHNTVSGRIKNARNEATYLYSDVQLVQTFRVYNTNVRELEDKIHAFFDHVRLNINIPDDKTGAVISPREWFVIQLDVIEEAINLILAGEIDDYSYDAEAKMIVLKSIQSLTKE